MKHSHAALNKILLEYLLDRQIYYSKKLTKQFSLKDIIQEAINTKELPILVRLILQEFPEHKDIMLKYLLIQ